MSLWYSPLGKPGSVWYSARALTHPRTPRPRPYSHLSPPNPQFSPKRVLILTKLSRFDFEKLRHPTLTDSQLETTLKKRGSDYNTLLYHHYIHKVSPITHNSHPGELHYTNYCHTPSLFNLQVSLLAGM